MSRNLGLAYRTARRFLGYGIELEDLRQEAALALITAVDQFEALRGATFSHFACRVIYRHLVAHVARHGASKDWSRDESEIDEFVLACVVEQVTKDELTSILHEALGDCPPSQKAAILEVYGFGAEPRSAATTATRTAAKKARTKIRKALQEAGWTDEDVRTVLSS